MTEQIQSGLLAMMQTMAAQNQVPQIGAKKGGEDQVDFQKMLEQKSQPAKEEAKPQQQDKTQQKQETEQQPAQQTGEQEDGQALVKRMAEAGLIPLEAANAYLMQIQAPEQQVQPELAVVSLAPESGELITPEWQEQPGEVINQGEQLEAIPLEEIQPEQLLETAQQAEEQPVEFQQTLETEAAPQREIAAEDRQEPIQQVEPQQREDQQEGLEQMDVSQGAQLVFREVEAAPIKVGEVYQPEKSGEADLNQQIAGPLNQALAQGQTKVEIHLNPEHLGSVKVEITQSAEGILRVALTAESSETRGLLEKHAANLQTLLSGREQQVEVEVQRQENGQQPQQNLYEDGHNGQNRQQQPRQQRQQGEDQDFLQKLRLGLTPAEVEL